MLHLVDSTLNPFIGCYVTDIPIALTTPKITGMQNETKIEKLKLNDISVKP